MGLGVGGGVEVGVGVGGGVEVEGGVGGSVEVEGGVGVGVEVEVGDCEGVDDDSGSVGVTMPVAMEVLVARTWPVGMRIKGKDTSVCVRACV